jgi:hypothetical protein
MAIQLSATDIHLTSTSSNFPNAVGPLTFMSWINYANWSAGVTASMVGVYLPGTTAIQIGTKTNSGTINIWTWGGGELINAVGLYTPTNNQWIHVAYTYDGINHTLYINGVLITTSTATQVAGVLTTMYINGYPTGSTNETSTVMIDDTLLFNRVLGLYEINTIYNCAGTRDGIAYGLNARYRYDESAPGDTVTTITDYSGNGNVLTPSGSGTPISYVATYVANDERMVFG